MIKLVFINILIISTTTLFSQQRFVTPIEGQYGKDFIIVNYVDWGDGNQIKDPYCLNKTYDGHHGTDFVLRSFDVMDSGIYVLAVDSGTIIEIQDGKFDREKAMSAQKGLGNYVVISHSGNILTYYGHLRKNSIIVKKGDKVIPGQKLALVGSSGNSTGPHLHFEVLDQNLNSVDPFSGPCGNKNSYWINELPFDTSFKNWISGFANYWLTNDTIIEEPEPFQTFYPTDTIIAYWNIGYGLRKNDSFKIEWYTPDNQLWFKFTYKFEQDWWYFFYWSYINIPPLDKTGLWHVKLYRNNKQFDDKEFYFESNQNDIKQKASNNIEYLFIQSDGFSIKVKTDAKFDKVQIHDLSGKLLFSKKFDNDSLEVYIKQNIKSGSYVLSLYNKEKFIASKSFIVL